MVKDPGNTLSTARLFPIRATNRTLRESLSATDQLDLWKVRLHASSFSMSLKRLARAAKADLYLLNAKGQAIASSKRPGNRDENLSVLLPSGTYYVAVLLGQRSASTKYALTVAAPPPVDYLGNSFDLAPSLNIGSSTTFSEFVGNRDPDDFIRFRLPAPGTLNLQLNNLSGNANLELYDRNGNLIDRSARAGTTNENISRRLIDYNSTFYIHVTQAPGSNSVYNFTYSFTPETPIRTASGLQYVDLVAGSGATPTTGQRLVVQYTGTLEDGTKFDSSRDRNQPFSFQIGTGSVIAGWDEGLSTMRVGGRRQLIIPAYLAYGASGRPGIPPNSTLVFDIELLSIT